MTDQLNEAGVEAAAKQAFLAMWPKDKWSRYAVGDVVNVLFRKVARAAITAYLDATGRETVEAAPTPETREPSEEAKEAAARAAVAASRPSADPDKLTPLPRGQLGEVPLWQTYTRLTDPALRAAYQIDFPAAPKAPSAEGWLTAEDTLRYVLRYGGNCRDCELMDGEICSTSGLPCRGSRKAVKWVLDALNYGVSNGYLPAPTHERTNKQ